jgi:hypothetical protein
VLEEDVQSQWARSAAIHSSLRVTSLHPTIEGVEDLNHTLLRS